MQTERSHNPNISSLKELQHLHKQATSNTTTVHIIKKGRNNNQNLVNHQQKRRRQNVKKLVVQIAIEAHDTQELSSRNQLGTRLDQTIFVLIYFTKKNQENITRIANNTISSNISAQILDFIFAPYEHTHTHTQITGSWLHMI